MRIFKTMVYARQKYKVNTYIGGIGITVNTPALLATKLNISVNRIKLFEIVESDIQCSIIGGSYIIPTAAFYNNSSITYYDDRIGLVSETDANAFRNSTIQYGIFPKATKINGLNASFSGSFQDCLNLFYVTAPKVNYLGFRAFYGCVNMLTADFPLLSSMPLGWAFYNCQSCVFTNSTTSNLTTLVGNDFYNCKAQLNFNFPSLLSINGGGVFDSCALVQNYYFPVLQTINGVHVFPFNSKLQGLNLPVCTQIGPRGNPSANSTEGFFRNNVLMTYFTAPLLTSFVSNFAFNTCSGITNIYTPLCNNLGGFSYNGLANNFFYLIKTGCSITVPIALQTINGGAVHPDILYATSSRGAAINYV